MRIKQDNSQKLMSLLMLAGLVTAVVVIVVQAQYDASKKSQGAGEKTTPTLTAKLIDPEKKAQQKSATVEVKTTGIEIIDPAKVNEMAKAGQGHVHYQVDDGPVIATIAMKLSFHGLSSGMHKIQVVLAGNDHNPLGPQQTLEVTIP